MTATPPRLTCRSHLAPARTTGRTMLPCSTGCCSSEVRGIECNDTDRLSVQPTAIQFSDGRIDNGTVHEPPHVYATTASPPCKRELATLLVEAAGQAAQWVTP